MPGSLLSALYELFNFTHIITYIEVNILIFPIVIRKSKFRVLKKLL